MKQTAGRLAAFIALAAGTAVCAHPLPKSSSPLPNAVLRASPHEIRLTFSEPLIAAFSGLALTDQAGKPVDIGPASVDPTSGKQLASPLKGRLAAGTYVVSWRAVGDDSHHVSGRYSFQVTP